MKRRLTLFCAALAAAGAARGQQALKTDTAGNPLTPLNLGGANVTGTLPASRLPAGRGSLQVETVAAPHGAVAVAPGADAVFLGVPLDGPLTLTLPPAGGRAAGRGLAVVDPRGYSSPACPALAVPAPGSGDTLNGGAAPVPLAGSGALGFTSDGAAGWTSDGAERTAQKGQPGGYAGLDAAGALQAPGGLRAASATVADLSVQPGQITAQSGDLRLQDAAGDLFLLGAYGAVLSAPSLNVNGPLQVGGQTALDGNALYLNGQVALDSSGALYGSGNPWYDGQGNALLTTIAGSSHPETPILDAAGQLLSRGTLTLLPVDPAAVATPASGVVHFVSQADGKEYAKDAAGRVHALW